MSRNFLLTGTILITAFIVWTILICKIDVQPIGPNDTKVGFSTFNNWFHQFTDVHMNIYTITDWLGLIPIFVCITFGIIGLIQLIKRKHLFKVDFDILILGIYYLIVIFCYLFFEMNPINYRPILIDGYLEASYPSSTTLLVLGVMPSAIDQIHYRIKNVYIKRILIVTAIAFSSFMVLGRLISGVHWFTDIIGAFLFSSGLFCLYKSVINK